MKSAISRLLDTYEKGKLSRRDLVQGLALLAAGSATWAADSGSMSAADFKAGSINHVSLNVSDLQRSTDFYEHVLGARVHKREGNNQAIFGKDFLVLRPGTPTGAVGHIAVGIDNFDKDSATAELKARGANPIETKDSSGLGFHVVDPDGFPVQIVSITNTGRG
jgi:catechol 2,3-dioxygenase-like lactoylglutathione lyase family enzyme